MAMKNKNNNRAPFLPQAMSRFIKNRAIELWGLTFVIIAILVCISLASFSQNDTSFNSTGFGPTENLLGQPGAYLADLLLQGFGLGSCLLILVFLAWGWVFITHQRFKLIWLRITLTPIVLICFAVGLSSSGEPIIWPTNSGLGGVGGFVISNQLQNLIGNSLGALIGLSSVSFILGCLTFVGSSGLKRKEWLLLFKMLWNFIKFIVKINRKLVGWLFINNLKLETDKNNELKSGDPDLNQNTNKTNKFSFWKYFIASSSSNFKTEPKLYKNSLDPNRETKSISSNNNGIVKQKVKSPKPSNRGIREGQRTLDLTAGAEYELPALSLLAESKQKKLTKLYSEESLEQNAKLLLSVLDDFGVYGEIQKVYPGPVVTLYEFVPQAGTRTSRVIGLADDIARSMSAISVRVATIPGKNVIGIELPNSEREGVLLRELLGSEAYENTSAKLTLALGKTISGEPLIADLARMPHLLVAGTTGSGKSVAVNSMILSLLYRLSPEQCRLILIDPKMLELSVYDDIPHLLTPVVTDPSKAVVALKWVVREMENRYQAMSKLGVRNITGYNKRLADARKKEETLSRRVQVGLDSETGQPLYEEQGLDLCPMPYIVVVVDEMADLMLVAGKDIEGAVQRLAQMARAAGIHLIMATQRPSVDVITGTIKANFPSRISFQVTSKIDSRTILGEAGAEQLLGQGDMLLLEGGGRLTRVHGPLVTDNEVEKVIKSLRAQGVADYKSEVIEEVNTGETLLAENTNDDPLYDQAVALVARERKASTSFVQRHLQIGYNRAARIVEQMESEGIISQANHVGKREVLISDYSGNN
tara:strand:+ start:6467 stop:8917 length:2451 start_codon:yes stop_codon:yes gene_type:complete